jgi:flagellar capping protein FliD
MAGMTVDGLVSGLDTTSLVNQLVNLEGQQQTALKTRLTATQSAAAAYRAVNTKFDALRSLAADFAKAAAWNPTKATSTATTVAVTAGSSAQPGALTFEVKATATSHSVLSARTWGTNTEAYGLTDPINVYDQNNALVGSIDVVGVGGAAPTLADAVKAINGSTYNLTAAAVQTSPGVYKLQVTAKDSGEAGKFSLGDSASSIEFSTTTAGKNAWLRVGEDTPYDVYSSTNKFDGFLPGVTLTVSKPEAAVTVEIASDPEAVATKMQALVDAANAALAEIKKYGDSKGGTSAVLKGDYSLTRLSGEILNAVAGAVGTGDLSNASSASASPGTAGVELTRDGTIKFSKEKFLAKLAEDPVLVQRLAAGDPGDRGTDGKVGTADDVKAPVPGVAMRLEALAKQAADKTTGSLVLLAKGRDEYADDLKDRIDAWDTRLEMRRAALTRQFSALEVALSKMNSQSSWLAGQIGSLPSWQ